MKAIAGMIFLLIFTLSIVPRKTLHNLFADHPEVCVKNIFAETQLHAANYNCDCNTDNITAPAELAAEVPVLQVDVVFPELTSLIIDTNKHAFLAACSLRGPPSASSLS